jgi:hypothetical protein
MQTKLEMALAAPSPFWRLVAATGLASLIVSAGMAGELLIPAAVLAVVLKIVVYGRLLAQVRPERPTAVWDILKEYALPYLVTVVLLGVVAVLARIIVARLATGPAPALWSSVVIGACLAAVTVFVAPLVFLQRASLGAILSGVTFLFRNAHESLWIVGLAVAGQALDVAWALTFPESPTGWHYALGVVLCVARAYLLFATYAAALHMVLGLHGDRQPVET